MPSPGAVRWAVEASTILGPSVVSPVNSSIIATESRRIVVQTQHHQVGLRHQGALGPGPLRNSGAMLSKLRTWAWSEGARESAIRWCRLRRR